MKSLQFWKYSYRNNQIVICETIQIWAKCDLFLVYHNEDSYNISKSYKETDNWFCHLEKIITVLKNDFLQTTL